MPWWFWPLAVAWSSPLVMIAWAAAWYWWEERQLERYAASAEARAEALIRRERLKRRQQPI